jgi:predicted nucleotidyltransferase
MRSKPTLQEGKSVAGRLKKAIQKRKDIRLHHVFLFGSVARKAAHEWSDIDVAVVCEQFDPSKVREARVFYSLFPQRDVRMSLVVLHPEEMEDKYSTLAEEIRKDGVEV